MSTPLMSSIPSPGDCLPTEAINRAVLLAAAVHDEGPDEVTAVLAPLHRQDLLELAVALAAMVPVDYTPAELLAWNDSRYRRISRPVLDRQQPLFPAAVVNGRPLRPHGTHAAFMRHRTRREEPCESCWHGEREYQRLRARRRRSTTPRTTPTTDRVQEVAS